MLRRLRIVLISHRFVHFCGRALLGKCPHAAVIGLYYTGYPSSSFYPHILYRICLPGVVSDISMETRK
jgi:hypothetical protein